MTAIPTRVRQLVNGVWQYVTADEDAGRGSLPDPVTTPVNVRQDAPAMQDSAVSPLTVKNSTGVHEYMTVGGPKAAAVVIKPDASADGGGDGLIVKGSVTTHTVLATSTGGGDYTVIDRLELTADGGDGSDPLDLIQTTRNGRVAAPPDDQADPYPGGVFRVLYAGALVTGQTFEPPDAQLAARQLAFWFDATDDAAKLMLKGKTADGTVVTGSVSLSP